MSEVRLCPDCGASLDLFYDSDVDQCVIYCYSCRYSKEYRGI